MTNRELIKLLRELEAQEEDFIRKLLIIKTKKDLVKKMLKMCRVIPLAAGSYSDQSVQN